MMPPLCFSIRTCNLECGRSKPEQVEARIPKLATLPNSAFVLKEQDDAQHAEWVGSAFRLWAKSCRPFLSTIDSARRRR
jgi:hypothetical protein